MRYYYFRFLSSTKAKPTVVYYLVFVFLPVDDEYQEANDNRCLLFIQKLQIIEKTRIIDTCQPNQKKLFCELLKEKPKTLLPVYLVYMLRIILQVMF